MKVGEMDRDVEKKNAKIVRTMLGVEDHGVFTFVISLDYGGSGQGYGTYALDSFDKAKKCRVGTAFGCEAIMRLLKVLEVKSWEDLNGKYCRVEATWDGVRRIGHPLNDQWLDLRELAREMGETA